jgi:hypothetical protein
VLQHSTLLLSFSVSAALLMHLQAAQQAGSAPRTVLIVSDQMAQQ